MPRLALTLSLALCTACMPDLRVDHPFDGEVSSGPLVVAEDLGGGARKLLIDATSKTAQVYVDLDEGKELKPDEAFATNGWDLWFKRYEIALNGGASNPSGVVRVAPLKDVDFASLAQAPADGWQQDTADKVFNVFDGGWFFYDLAVHKLQPRADLVWVLQTSAGAYVKLRMLRYYDENGTPAALALEYAPVTAP